MGWTCMYVCGRLVLGLVWFGLIGEGSRGRGLIRTRRGVTESMGSNNTAIFHKGFQLAVGVMILKIAGFLLVPNVCPPTTTTSVAPTKKKKREGPPSTTTTTTPHHVSSWSFKFKKLVTCMLDGGKAQEILNPTVVISKGSLQRRSWIDCSGSGLCNIRDVAHGNTRVMHGSETEISSVVHDEKSGSCSCSRTRTLTLTQDDLSNHPVGGSSSLRFSRGMHLTKWSGCYECRMIVDPIQAFSSFPATIFACSSCGQIFTNSDALEQHQAIKHAGHIHFQQPFEVHADCNLQRH